MSPESAQRSDQRRLAGLRRPALAAALLLGLAVSAPAVASPELVRSRNCVSCHTVERKLIGPAYQDIARRYRNDGGAAAKLARKIREGGGGAWGVVKMPANPQVSEDESVAIARWILSLP